MTAQYASYLTEEAKVIGRIPALVVHHIRGWMRYAKHLEEGRMWIFRTLEQIAEAISCSVSSVRRAIKKLVDEGYIVKKQLLKHKYCRTMYYSVCSDKALRSRQSEPAEPAKMNTSYKNSNPYKKKDKKKTPAEMVQVLAKLAELTEELPTTAELTPKLGTIPIEVSPGIVRHVLNDGLWPIEPKRIKKSS